MPVKQALVKRMDSLKAANEWNSLDHDRVGGCFGDPFEEPGTPRSDACPRKGEGHQEAGADAEGRSTYCAQDALDRLSSTSDALGQTELYASDANGNLATPDGRTAQFAYDALNRSAAHANWEELGRIFEAHPHAFDPIRIAVSPRRPGLGRMRRIHPDYYRQGTEEGGIGVPLCAKVFVGVSVRQWGV